MLKTYYYVTKWEPAASDYSKIVGADVTEQNFLTYDDSWFPLFPRPDSWIIRERRLQLKKDDSAVPAKHFQRMLIV